MSGGLEPSRLTGARYALVAAEYAAFAHKRIGLREGDVLQAGATGSATRSS